MTAFSFLGVIGIFTAAWLIVRGCIWYRQRRIDWRREGQLLWLYVCSIVVIRLTFFPFSRVEGQIQPLLFDVSRMLPPRINVLPFVHLFDYPTAGEILLNVIGNSVLFLPYGILFPALFCRLRTHGAVLAAGVGTSLLIEFLQLPFYDRVSDVDDLILNTVGYLIGYGSYCLVQRCRHRKRLETSPKEVGFPKRKS